MTKTPANHGIPTYLYTHTRIYILNYIYTYIYTHIDVYCILVNVYIYIYIYTPDQLVLDFVHFLSYVDCWVALFQQKKVTTKKTHVSRISASRGVRKLVAWQFSWEKDHEGQTIPNQGAARSMIF